MNRVAHRKFEASFRENKGRLVELPDTHFLALAWDAIVRSLLNAIQEADKSDARFEVHRNRCDGACFRASYRRSSVIPTNDLKWVLTATESTLSVALETPPSAAKTVSFDQFDQNSSRLVEALLEIPCESGSTRLKVDNIDVNLPQGIKGRSSSYVFSRIPGSSLHVSLIGPLPNQSLSPDLLSWVHDAACHLSPIFALLAPPCDVDIKGSDANESMAFPEGARRYRIHTARERSRALVSKAKREHSRLHGGRLPCEVCGFDFNAMYGDRGSEYAEAHHRLPLSESGDDRESRAEDLAVVCANCHRMLHRSPFMTVEELHGLLDARHGANPGGQPKTE